MSIAVTITTRQVSASAEIRHVVTASVPARRGPQGKPGKEGPPGTIGGDDPVIFNGGNF